MSNVTINKVVEQLATLPDDLQAQVLEYIQILKAGMHKGVHGSQLLAFASTILPDDLELMAAAIQECEQVDLDEW